MDLFGRKRIKALEIQLAHRDAMLEQYRNELSRYADLKTAILRHNLALGRIIGKLDPIYVEPEMSAERRAASDEIGRKVLEKLFGENKAANHSTGGL